MLRMILLALAALIGMAAPASAQNVDRVRCESRNYQPNACPAYNARNVQIVEQLGGTCRQGADWNFDGRNIYVRNGCRAVFGLVTNNYGNDDNYRGNNANQIVRCESQNFRRNRCPMDTRGGVQLQRQIGNSGCVQGQTWGWDRSSVWVDRGCRAEFRSAGGNSGGWNGGNNGGNQGGNIIECSSRNYQPARCNAAIQSGVSIDRVLGGECIQGRSWGYDRGGVWVNNGCRARFRIY